ncbi:maleylpyruvate isomerase family mycothiol-dependent enzyme [Actinoplanes solisilvae]|uniref:maleylpyruvate isomerase family mycothiol-dependent enzyme n=1 Tax=Actinoplanes solisilvae TaxID=2486853 RepID=UPI000FD8F80D|nr:maleylpyruvate isomerase family mycothiol-dependent enzyme [Actinoplanes solisilvae]
MTTLAGRTIAVLRSEHDNLASIVPGLSAEQLTGASGASDWTVADVLSHLGSGAELTRAGLRAALDGTDAPGMEFNQGVWDRWNALSPQDQASAWLGSDAALLADLEAVPEERHDDVKVALSFLPEPLPLASFAAMRLSEVVQHSWDVRAGLDPAATLPEASALLLAEHLSNGLSFMLGFMGKPAAVREHAVIGIGETSYRIVLTDQVRLTTEDVPTTATFTGELEAALRLVYGRLTPEYTPAGVEVKGNISLDELRAAFPGF